MDLIFEAPKSGEKEGEKEEDDVFGLGLGDGDEEGDSAAKAISEGEKSLYDEGFWKKMKDHITQLPHTPHAMSAHM